MSKLEQDLIRITERMRRDWRDSEEVDAESPEPPKALTRGELQSAFKKSYTGEKVTMSSSIASARRGRPNDARNEDYYELVGDFTEIVSAWRVEQGEAPSILTAGHYLEQRQRERLRSLVADDEAEPRDTFILYITPFGDGTITEIELDADYRIPAGTKVPRVNPPAYGSILTCPTKNRNVTGDFSFTFEGDGPIDITKLTPLSDDEIRATLRAIQFAETAPEPAPPAPSFERIARTAGDPCSYLGFVIGTPERDIQLSNRWTYVAFNLPAPAMIGSLTSSIHFPHDYDYRVRVLIFDTFGAKVLETELTKNGRTRFNHTRLESGDYLLVFGGCSLKLGASGSYNAPHSGLLARAPEKPLLDTLLKQEAMTDVFGDVIEVGLPQFRFEAE